MLKSKSVAKIIEKALNSISQDEKFKIFDSAGDYKGVEINGVLKQGKATIVPTLNYINANVPYTLEFVVPLQCGEDRIDNIVNIVNSAIKSLNGKLKIVDSGKAIFLFDTVNMGNLETRASTGQSLILGLSFSVEYSNKDVGTRYQIALIDNEFSGTINTRYFESQQDQARYYETKIDKGAYNDLLSPNINSLVLSQQRYANENSEDVNDLLMYNYAIIKETKEDGTTKHYYYDIASANVNTNNIIILDLKMDTIQTWYFNPDIRFDKCFISKADINRFIEDPLYGPNYIRFDTTIDSQLFEREDVKNVTKRLVSREVINPVRAISWNDSKIINWINENVLGWYYIFLSSNKRYRITGDLSISWRDKVGYPETKLMSLNYLHKEWDPYSGTDAMGELTGEIYNTMVCLVAPVMKTNKKMYMAELKSGGEPIPGGGITPPEFTENKLELGQRALENFISNNSPDYIYTMKFSLVPPFRSFSGEIFKNSEISDDGDLYIFGKVEDREYTVRELIDNKDIDAKYTYKVLTGKYSVPPELDCIGSGEIDEFGRKTQLGMLNLLYQYHTNMDIPYSIDSEFRFKRAELIDVDHDIKFNPKLLSSDYSSLILSDNLQNGAEYDILKIGDKSTSILYTEALTPDISRRYIRFKTDNGYYHSALSENLTGYIVTDDTSITLETSQYQSMLANNKNFFLQNSINREAEQYRANLGIGNSIATSLLGVVGSAATGTLLSGGNPIGGVIGATAGLASSGVSIGTSIANANKNQEVSKTLEKLQVDNLKNAPNSINGAKGNVIFNAMYSDMGVVVERHEIIPNEKKMVDDRINMFGMTVNKVKNIKDYDNLRRYHNYIEADIEGIQGISISNAIRDDIRQRFANGIRFWNKNKDGEFVISYEKENYERWLED